MATLWDLNCEVKDGHVSQVWSLNFEEKMVLKVCENLSKKFA